MLVPDIAYGHMLRQYRTLHREIICVSTGHRIGIYSVLVPGIAQRVRRPIAGLKTLRGFLDIKMLFRRRQ